MLWRKLSAASARSQASAPLGLQRCFAYQVCAPSRFAGFRTSSFISNALNKSRFGEFYTLVGTFLTSCRIDGTGTGLDWAVLASDRGAFGGAKGFAKTSTRGVASRIIMTSHGPVTGCQKSRPKRADEVDTDTP